ncbi:glycosyltransferase [Chamaesiphon minutus]|uniref:Glycosyltransferase n=1 Tax=Chamaesiphon minutus (strain ATCC 27169 / PCC 6605) TaxID=1173020 RepID=K9UAY4_CHAP6|nr:glycosyltransferase [Chamaesiphon minutus]AFY91601.1 glycosyltransferase [Chamaesiphon minutus PCC 6605]
MINLHVMHSWGGGLERWVKEYAQSDTRDTNFVLKSIGEHGTPAKQIHLYRHIEDRIPLRMWELDKPIVSTSATHLEYRYILQEIIDVFKIDCILISSFIGHAFELLHTDRRTVIICHDFYPFCPVIIAYFKGNCEECNFSHLKTCFAENPVRFFPFTSAIEWMEIRETFVRMLKGKYIPLIIPSPFIKDRLVSLEPKLADVPMFVISHGISPLVTVKSLSTELQAPPKNRPRIMILGELSTHKGLELFGQICDRLCEVADVYLVGCGDDGYAFKRKRGVTIISHYKREELAAIVDKLEIDLGLLLSVWTETFSFTLSELMSMGIPTLATKIGSFADRIEDGVNGFLVPPNPEKIVLKVNDLLDDPKTLQEIRDRLSSFQHKSVEEMVIEYQERLENEAFDSQKIATLIPAKTLPQDLDLEQLQLQIALWQHELADLRLSHAKLANQLEYKEFYPNWKISKNMRVPLSKRFSMFKYAKRLFPGLWQYLRNLAINFKVLY